MSIEEAADKYEKANTGIYPEVGQTSIRDAFIDGYNLCREQMMKEAIEGTVDFEYFGYKVIRTDLKQLDTLLESMNHGDKVRIVVCKNED